jgi:isopentenyl diphosphate isomerase/L-lactate dehydrogenase-like FMN-dependent dehydrogenase
MSIERRGLTHLRTMAGLRDASRNRTSHGALLELSMLGAETLRLTTEMQRAERRCADIRKRIAEIDIKAHRLHRFVEKPFMDAPSVAEADPRPTHTVPPGKAKSRRLSY